jgi:hypothetical protein
MKFTFHASNVVSELINIDDIEIEYEMSETDLKTWYENAPALIDRIVTAVAINIDRIQRERAFDEDPIIGD